MTQSLPANPPDVAEITRLLGPPAILTSESESLYYEMIARLLACFRPKDFLEIILVKELVDLQWEIMRCTRHKTFAIKFRVKDVLNFQTRRAQMIAARKAARQPPVSEGAYPDLAAAVDFDIKEIDDLIAREADEFNHSRAIETALYFTEKLDRALSIAFDRRDATLQLFSLYREGLGQQLRRVSDQILEAEVQEIKAAETPLVPESESQ